ncbi:hypothetical protein [Clostridium sp. BJN0001]|uniref:hypothetical protein n=1 Tax=Clostridium sp. BJN0001 TaxID=2930219 RepID=UPI001FD0D39D|nr:hypothetical protein [Clostridium sp. BJN0001]
MDLLISIFLIVSIVFMFIFTFLGIWIFIIGIKAYKQTRYRNYILEKIDKRLSVVSDHFNQGNNDYSYLTGETPFEFEDDDNTKLDNIKNFSKK